MSNFVDLAHELAKKAHAGQRRRNGDDYFYGHVKQVYNITRYYLQNKNYSEGMVDEILSVALLHDVLEDTGVTTQQLLEIFPERVVDSIRLLTKGDKEYGFYITKLCELYEDFGDKCIECEIALIVKLCDLTHNMSDFSEKDKKGSQYAKYMLARYLINRTLK